jgi:hypothetical protein
VAELVTAGGKTSVTVRERNLITERIYIMEIVQTNKQRGSAVAMLSASYILWVFGEVQDPISNINLA